MWAITSVNADAGAWSGQGLSAKSLSIQQHYEPCQQSLNKQCTRKNAVLLMLDLHEHRSECFPDNFTWQADSSRQFVRDYLFYGCFCIFLSDKLSIYILFDMCLQYHSHSEIFQQVHKNKKSRIP